MEQHLDDNFLQDEEDGLTTVISSAHDEDVVIVNGVDWTTNEISNSPRNGYSSSPSNSNINGEKRRKPTQSSRRPFHYPVDRHGSFINDTDVGTAATYSRYRYYSKLSPPEDRTLEIPNHIIPATFFSILPQSKKQSSIVTIFSIWNTMMGTSLLSMPWALGQAGLILGICLMMFMAGLTLYTCYRIMKSTEGIEVQGDVLEFSDVCRQYLGRWGEYCSVFFSLSALLGALIVYWVLLSNFLYNTVNFIYDNVNHINVTEATISGAICNNDEIHHTSPDKNSLYEKIWSPTHTVPLFLIVILFPFMNFKSPTFFTKFNAFGTVSVLYLVSFVIYYGAHWKINLDFSQDQQLVSTKFPALTGILALAYFIHSCILSILRNQSQPKNNGRDLTVAYVLVAFTYTLVGFVFYATFPCEKMYIHDNFLDNFTIGNPAAFVARLCLFFQMVTVFPLVVYIFRVQIMHTLFSTVYPGMKYILALNVVIVGICLIFAVFLPHIGNIIRFSGAFCGLAYIFTLPCLIYLCAENEKGTLTASKIIFHTIIIGIGVANFIGQFLILT